MEMQRTDRRPMCVCLHVRLSCFSGGDASVGSSSRAGAVLLHLGPAARSRAGAGRTAGPATCCTDSGDHPARTDHHRTAATGTGTVSNVLYSARRKETLRVKPTAKTNSANSQLDSCMVLWFHCVLE